MSQAKSTLVLRLAAPLQSWGERSQFNRRDTANEPTKSGVLGLLAAAQGRARQDDIDDLRDLDLGVRVDQPGTLLRDYHTVSDYRGRPLLAAAVNNKGMQKPTSPAKQTHVTKRYYLQDAVFVAAVSGPHEIIAALHDAVLRPAFPLALGRRACVPTQPILLAPHGKALIDGHSAMWQGDPLSVLRSVPWQASPEKLRQLQRQPQRPAMVDLPVTVDAHDGDDVRVDLPTSFDPKKRSFTARKVRHSWVSIPTPFDAADESDGHDPFALLGW
ncbi:type I-E CRISPR-associated protein Cas5/CasD [Amycolatopsis taiwanensis]|uniref:Type I-E CRISPR-associated protein Cas5/CasD n=1 Tax=Amycolatopsis taiwanensis TaxID=342230 RepID=A0A9W6R5L7_9PSEU|nr:type I-E CRISPR-associated protein Cas5/CasD [Amycolatopsis taiwanensis]GLY68775.1 type I-E CRISPR-associated protein Cas5/CasD [Amycolatopsis taiwanensis]